MKQGKMHFGTIINNTVPTTKNEDIVVLIITIALMTANTFSAYYMPDKFLTPYM
jgi:hypothetical protein